MPRTHPVAATPVAFAHAVVEAYRRHGRDPSGALARAQIPPDLLAQPGGRITAWQIQQLSGTAMQELDDEALGWFTRRLPWGSYGMLARASLSAPTLKVALGRWARHHGLLVPDVTVALHVAGGIATLRILEHRDLGILREFCLMSLLRNALGLSCWYIDSRIPLLGLQFPFDPPPHRAAYAVLFPGPPTTFGAEEAALRFDARYLDLPLRRDEGALTQMLQNALPLTVLQYRRDRLLVQQVRQALAAHPGQAHSIEGLAALLHLSPRSIHRHLKEEGTTLQALKDSVRRDLARDLLLRTRKPLKQVAEAAGFQNEKSFIRAFKAWTGQTPAAFRQGP